MLLVAQDRAARAAVRAFVRAMASAAEGPDPAGRSAITSGSSLGRPIGRCGSHLDTELVSSAHTEVTEESMASVEVLNIAAEGVGINVSLAITLDEVLEARRNFFAIDRSCREHRGSRVSPSTGPQQRRPDTRRHPKHAPRRRPCS